MMRPRPRLRLSEADAKWVRGGFDEITVTMTLRGDLARCLCRHALERNTPPAVLLTSIVEAVLKDDIVNAVIDT